eukprot:13524568-Ditylum_brightwellii.AAC.1
MLGNYGVPNRNTIDEYGLPNTVSSLGDCLKEEGISGLCDINTASDTAMKLPFRNSGQNQQVLSNQNGECYITNQNHRYVIDTNTLEPSWKILFTNANISSNEGIAHKVCQYFTAHFHPEAPAGPTGTEFMFNIFLDACKKGQKDYQIIFPACCDEKKDKNEMDFLMFSMMVQSIDNHVVSGEWLDSSVLYK